MPSSDTVAPTRSRPRGRPPRISQDRIVEAALHLGLDGFSMQGIAEHLGVTPPALYTHVAGRDEVLDLVNAALRRHLDDFDSPASDWQEWMADFAHLVRTHLASSASVLMVDLRRPDTSGQVTVAERGLQLLIAEGLSPTEAGLAVWLVFRTALTAGPDQHASLAGYVDDTGQLLGPVPAEGLPATTAVHDALVADGPGDTFAFDLSIVLAGIAARIAALPKRPTRRRPARGRS